MTRRTRARPVVGPGLRRLLVVLLVAFSLLAVNSGYLGLVTLLEWYRGEGIQDHLYQYMFLFHLAAGLLVLPPAGVFIALHMRNAWRRPNRHAVYAGLGLFAALLVLFASGLLLVRFDFFRVRSALLRDIAYWLHVVTPLLCAWLFVLHRLAGPRIRWRTGGLVAVLGAGGAVALVLLQMHDPRDSIAPEAADAVDFSPSLVRSASGRHIPAESLMMDGYCQDCHADVHAQWSESVHRFASFNNPVYLFSVRNTRRAALERDGNVKAARFCAGCHDLVPLLSGAFDDPDFDDVDHPTAHAGLTCTVCHAISEVHSPRGTADFTIEEPIHYPFTFSDNALLQWINGQLIKAKPQFHARTYLKPLHRSAEFCAGCHKLHLPEELNDYKWLRGQNHYDSFLLSGVSGHGVQSFYYPQQAEANCNGCHMPAVVSDDFGGRVRPPSGEMTVLNHLFPAANTAIPQLVGLPQSVVAAHQAFLRDTVRVDLVALREGSRVDGPLLGPIRPEVPALAPGRSYLLQAVIRNLKTGHHFTQGTTDSNEVWLEVRVEHEGRVIGQSGGIAPADHAVDPWSHFVNAYLLDREGNRIARRNPEDIFVALYDHQLPPGSADLVHYRLEVPPGLAGEITVTLRLNYRKFDTTLMRHVQEHAFVRNELPITTIAEDRVTFPVGRDRAPALEAAHRVPEWERWNDYGIGALRKPQGRQLRQAEEIFARVEALGHGAGPLNLARAYLQEGRLDEAADALRRAMSHHAPPPPWSIAWFSGLLLFEQGRLEEALGAFEALVETQFPEARDRGFDFSRDYRLLNQLGLTWLEIARRASPQSVDREDALRHALDWFENALAEDPENVTAHYNLAQVHRQLGTEERAALHAGLHQHYRVDDNARDRAVTAARRADPAADHAADPVVIHELHRAEGQRFSLSAPETILRNAAP